jgi:uncharacterized membrane protein YphA (DoxX/SURF4 family)
MTMLAIPEIGIAIRTLTGLVFGFAAIGKMRHWPILQGVVANYRLLPEILVVPVTVVLPPLEAVLGVTLLLGIASPWPELAAATLLAVFALAMAVNLRRGRRHIDCGCFQGALKQTLRWSLVVRNGVLVLLLGVASVTASGAFDPWTSINGLLAGGVLFLLLQCLNIFWSIVPSWQRSHSHLSGGAK